MNYRASPLLWGLFNRITLAPNDDSGSESYDDFDDGDDSGDDDGGDDDLDDPDADDEDDQDPDEGDDGDDDPQPRRQSSRGESRQARLARENRELRSNQEQMQRTLEDLQRGQQQRQQPQGETPEQLQARLAQMDPVERVAELQRMSNQNTHMAIQGLQFQIADTNDQTSFNGLLARTPGLAKHADEVEKRLKQYRQNGMNIPRADVLKHILGEKAMESAGRSRSKAQRQADSRREAQRARPGGSRSDGGREGREKDSSKAARDKRLDNMKI